MPIFAVLWIAGLGTVFGPSATDPQNPRDDLACFPGRKITNRDFVVALPARRAKCGARLVVCLPRTGRCVRAVVGDRGPRRADIDLSPAVARWLGHDGREAVVWAMGDGPAERRGPWSAR